MAKLTITEAFARYGAILKNPQWSVSAWAPDGSLVVSLWNHHYRKSTLADTMEFADSLDRWPGNGNREFRANVAKAYAEGKDVRLVIATTLEVEKVQAGEDAKNIPKDYDAREEMVGRVLELDGVNYAFRFQKVLTKRGER